MDEWIESFRQTVENAHHRLSEISDRQSAIAPVPGKWSAKEIIGHLIDSAANNHQRFVRAQSTDDLIFTGYEQGEWVRVQHYNERPWLELVELWRQYNLHLAHVMSHAPSEAKTKPRARHNLHQLAWQTVAEDAPVTLEYFMRDYVGHLRHHLDQIFVPLAASTGPNDSAR